MSSLLVPPDGKSLPVGAGVKGYLLDENLPYRLRFQPAGAIFHATEIRGSASDNELWEFALLNELTIVTKDGDFSERILLSEPPPWIVHLRFGNLRLNDFHGFLERVWPRVEELLKTSKMVNVYLETLEAVS